mgnify:CR=1 FL=1
MNKKEVRIYREKLSDWCDPLYQESEPPKKERRFVGGPCCLCGESHDTRDCPSSERR